MRASSLTTWTARVHVGPSTSRSSSFQKPSPGPAPTCASGSRHTPKTGSRRSSGSSSGPLRTVRRPPSSFARTRPGSGAWSRRRSATTPDAYRAARLPDRPLTHPSDSGGMNVRTQPGSTRMQQATPINFTVNGRESSVTTEPQRSLLEVLREDVQLTGTMYGCGEGACGACAVLLDGRAVFSCTTPVSEAAGKSLTTIEGLSDGEKLHAVQE